MKAMLSKSHLECCSRRMSHEYDCFPFSPEELRKEGSKLEHSTVRMGLWPGSNCSFSCFGYTMTSFKVKLSALEFVRDNYMKPTVK